jgi:serine/threonine protein kinase
MDNVTSAQLGPFRLHELINRGGTAEIWLASDQQGRTVALRRLHTNGFFDFKIRKQFMRGCEILSRIHDHEHVIGYVEHGKIDGTYYLVMEYVEGANLKQMLARSDPVLHEHVAQLLIDMAVALEHVHDFGYMHLDFKPENVLVTPNASIRLLDFDLAEPIPEKPKKLSSNAGTPAYMSPEQLLREPLDQRADMFSFGVTAYEVLTNHKPFIGVTQEEVLRRQLDHDHPITPPKRLNADIPVALERIVMRCLERDMEKRYPSMIILRRELELALYV